MLGDGLLTRQRMLHFVLTLAGVIVRNVAYQPCVSVLCKYYVVHAHVICRICNLSFETCANWNGAEQCGNNDVFLSDASCDGDCPANCCQLRVCFLQKILRADCNANARVRFAPTTLSRVRRRNAGLMILPSYS